MSESRIFTLEPYGIKVDIGTYAKQANGSVWIQAGNNIVLCTATASREAKEFPGFFPLTVEYRERFSAAGRIPGGFIKREGKLSDQEVLISRLIDRPVRPLFPTYYFNEVQLISNVLSSDASFPNSVLALIGSSLALAISDIPFLGPVGAVQANKVEGKWVFNQPFATTSTAKDHVVIAGTEHGICMIEGFCNKIDRAELLEVLFDAHKQIIEQVQWQKEIVAAIGKAKQQETSSFNWEMWKEKVQAVLPKDFMNSFYTDVKSDRSLVIESSLSQLFASFSTQIKEGEVSKNVIQFLFDLIIKEQIGSTIISQKKRFDGRNFDTVRPIKCAVGILPCTHGSALFQRGETQVVATITLGTGQDAQKIESITSGLQERLFMLHYNFPPFATGEVRAIRGVGRRELGHGYLAENSFINILPSQDDFPYTVRSVADTLESNGSSSMATVCASTLALMDAGVPIKEMVAGIAIGLLRSQQGEDAIIIDIVGREDGYGLMDLKIAGNQGGIYAIQMDIKDKKGLARELFVEAFEKADVALTHILKEMQSVMTSTRNEISRNAPRVLSFKVPTETIGAIIGLAGKNIKELIKRTGTSIDIDDDGTVKIYAKNSEQAQEAAKVIKIVAGDIQEGMEFDGIIRKFADFGIFVELAPGKDGLIHISQIARDKIAQFNETIHINDPIKVRVLSYEKASGKIKLVAPSIEGDKAERAERAMQHRAERAERGDRPERSERPGGFGGPRREYGGHGGHGNGFGNGDRSGGRPPFRKRS